MYIIAKLNEFYFLFNLRNYKPLSGNARECQAPRERRALGKDKQIPGSAELQLGKDKQIPGSAELQLGKDKQIPGSAERSAKISNTPVIRY